MEGNAELTTPFPLPPTYYTRYTQEIWPQLQTNLTQYGITPSEDSSENDTREIKDLPSLLPPPIPENRSEYVVFGRIYKLEEDFPSLKELGIDLLYTSLEDQDFIKELKGLNKSVLAQFQALMEQLVVQPASLQPEDDDLSKQLDRLNLTLINMMQMVNRLRPAQARATLLKVVETRIQHFQAVTKKARGKCQDIKTNLREYRKLGPQNNLLTQFKNSNEKSRTLSKIDEIQVTTVPYVDSDPRLKEIIQAFI